MKRIRRIFRAPGRALAPRWVRMAWVLVLATACGITVAWAQDHSFELGRASGAAEAARQAAASFDTGFTAGQRHEERRSRGVVELEDLPPGTDRKAAAAAEAAYEGYAFLAEHPESGCTVMVRQPGGTVIGIPDKTDGVGLTLDTRYHPCVRPLGKRLPGYPAPTVADLPRRWDSALSAGNAYAYSTRDGVRLDIYFCGGYLVPREVPPGGVAVSESTPLLAGDTCSRAPKPR